MNLSNHMPSRSLSVLLAILILLFFISPIAQELEIGQHFFKIILCSVSLSCIYIISQKTSYIIAGVFLALPGFWMTFSTDSFEYSTTEVIGLVSNLLLYLMVIYAIGCYIKNRQTIDRHIISGSICIYMLLGLVWSICYMLIELLIPNSFNGIYGSTLIQAHNISTVFNHLFYYSYVTLTTLGYGSISPRTVLGSAFSAAEAITGQLYIAIFVAQLVSLYTTQEVRRINNL